MDILKIIIICAHLLLMVLKKLCKFWISAQHQIYELGISNRNLLILNLVFRRSESGLLTAARSKRQETKVGKRSGKFWENRIDETRQELKQLPKLKHVSVFLGEPNANGTKSLTLTHE